MTRAKILPGAVWTAKRPPHYAATVVKTFLLTSPFARPGVFGSPSVEVSYKDGSSASFGVGHFRSLFKPPKEG